MLECIKYKGEVIFCAHKEGTIVCTQNCDYLLKQGRGVDGNPQVQQENQKV